MASMLHFALFLVRFFVKNTLDRAADEFGTKLRAFPFQWSISNQIVVLLFLVGFNPIATFQHTKTQTIPKAKPSKTKHKYWDNDERE